MKTAQWIVTAGRRRLKTTGPCSMLSRDTGSDYIQNHGMKQKGSYSSEFFDGQFRESLRSAELVVPILIELLHPTSVVDVGSAGWVCGCLKRLPPGRALPDRFGAISRPFSTGEGFLVWCRVTAIRIRGLP